MTRCLGPGRPGWFIPGFFLGFDLVVLVTWPLSVTETIHFLRKNKHRQFTNHFTSGRGLLPATTSYLVFNSNQRHSVEFDELRIIEIE